MSLAAQTTEDFKGDRLSVRMFGAQGDTLQVADAAITSGAAILSSASALFMAAAVGKLACVSGAGVAGAALLAAITGFTDTSHVTLATAASATVTAALASWGTDDTAAIQAGIGFCSVNRAALYVPPGQYQHSGLAIHGQVTMYGAGGSGNGLPILLYTGTGTALSIRDAASIENPIYAVHLYNLGFRSTQLAAIGIAMYSTSECQFSGLEVGGSPNTPTGGKFFSKAFYLYKANISGFRDIVESFNAIAFHLDSNDPFAPCAALTFDRCDLFRNSTAVFKINSGVDIVICNTWIEDFNVGLDFENPNSGDVMNCENIWFRNNSVLADGDPTQLFQVLRCVATAAQPYFKLKSLHIIENRLALTGNTTNPFYIDTIHASDGGYAYPIASGVTGTIRAQRQPGRDYPAGQCERHTHVSPAQGQPAYRADRRRERRSAASRGHWPGFGANRGRLRPQQPNTLRHGGHCRQDRADRALD